MRLEENGHCGKALVGKYAKNGKFAYYVCGTLDKKGRGSCQVKYLNADKFETLIVSKIRERILTMGNLINLVKLEIISGYVDELHELLKEGSLAERRTFIRSFVKEIRVTGNEAGLSYSIPLLQEKVAIEKEGVLPTVHCGGRYWT